MFLHLNAETIKKNQNKENKPLFDRQTYGSIELHF